MPYDFEAYRSVSQSLYDTVARWVAMAMFVYFFDEDFLFSLLFWSNRCKIENIAFFFKIWQI